MLLFPDFSDWLTPLSSDDNSWQPQSRIEGKVGAAEAGSLDEALFLQGGVIPSSGAAFCLPRLRCSLPPS